MESVLGLRWVLDVRHRGAMGCGESAANPAADDAHTAADRAGEDRSGNHSGRGRIRPTWRTSLLASDQLARRGRVGAVWRGLCGQCARSAGRPGGPGGWLRYTSDDGTRVPLGSFILHVGSDVSHLACAHTTHWVAPTSNLKRCQMVLRVAVRGAGNDRIPIGGLKAQRFGCSG